MKILVIDDEREFHFPDDEVTYARNLAQAIIELRLGNHWDEVWLDNDLGIVNGKKEEVKTLTREIERLVGEENFRFDVDRFVVHTQNPIAREELISALEIWYDVFVVVNLKPWFK